MCLLWKSSRSVLSRPLPLPTPCSTAASMGMRSEGHLSSEPPTEIYLEKALLLDCDVKSSFLYSSFLPPPHCRRYRTHCLRGSAGTVRSLVVPTIPFTRGEEILGASEAPCYMPITSSTGVRWTVILLSNSATNAPKRDP